ncbi:hypothetical protein BST61_g8474 [Cercospora zeina]
MSMKSDQVTSGPISLLIQTTVPPSIILTAEFFVKTPDQEPLRFAGGMSISPTAAKLFIELKDQYWERPFGLNGVRLGKGLALQIGIVYAGPIYPSEVGLAGGLTVGKVSGQAALSISDSPTDQLISLEVNNLDLQDIVSFASTVLQVSPPLSLPDNLLFFKQVKLYLSTGTTIGMTFYPPGASFKCDAVLFGKSAKVYCAIDKSKGMMQITGSLDPIEVGPLTVSGHQDGTPLTLDVRVSPAAQSLFFDGGIRLTDLDVRANISVALQPKPMFDIDSELSFSDHLTFSLNAHMRNSLPTSLDVSALDFDISAAFQQDILDYVVAQVNTQLLAAAVDHGIVSAVQSLDAAEKAFQAQVNIARQKWVEARGNWEHKRVTVTVALRSEQNNEFNRIGQLSGEVERARQAFDAAVENAQAALTRANEARIREIKNKEQDVEDAKTQTKAIFGREAAKLASAKDSMAQQFGAATANIAQAQSEVDAWRPEVESARRDKEHWDNEVRGLASHPWDAPAVLYQAGIAEATLRSRETSFNAANWGLFIAMQVVQQPAYKIAQGIIDAADASWRQAGVWADETLGTAQRILEDATAAQDKLVAIANNALDTVRTNGPQKSAFDLADRTLREFQKAEYELLGGLQEAFDKLGSTAEKIALDQAQALLDFALANTKDVDIAKRAIEWAGSAAKDILGAYNWTVANAMNILNLREIKISGDLRALVKQNKPLKASVHGTFAGQKVDFDVEFFPGKGADFAHSVFTRLFDDVKSGLLVIVA